MASNGSLTTKTLKRLAVGVLLFAVQSGGASGETLYQFGGVATDGSQPYAKLIQGSDGYFYGTTSRGETNGNGTVFRISSAGMFNTLYQFGGGSEPYSGLVQDSGGNSYGTSFTGGVPGIGYVYRISPGGSFTNLYSFHFISGKPSDGANPYTGLVQGSDGNFYGMTFSGGTYGNGIVFRISTSGSFTNLYSFSGPDGKEPYGDLVQGGDGNFYGTTLEGGTSTNCVLGCGIVFRINASGSLTNLHSFSYSDGAIPYATLVQGSDSSFYGTTARGGTNDAGTVFRISSAGNLTTLWQFGGVASNGIRPDAGVVQGSDGSFYGTTQFGGTNGAGTVFRISSAGTLTTLWQFGGVASDGRSPAASLVQGSDGYFYGTTQHGGTNNLGTVFKIFAPLNPPANQISAIQLSDTNIVISIPSVAGETYQLQFCDSLTDGSWSNVDGASVTNSIGAMLTLTNFGGALQQQGFYRFSITP